MQTTFCVPRCTWERPSQMAHEDAPLEALLVLLEARQSILSSLNTTPSHWDQASFFASRPLHMLFPLPWNTLPCSLLPSPHPAFTQLLFPTTGVSLDAIFHSPKTEGPLLGGPAGPVSLWRHPHRCCRENHAWS